jgi:hypothetical protein
MGREAFRNRCSENGRLGFPREFVRDADHASGAEYGMRRQGRRSGRLRQGLVALVRGAKWTDRAHQTPS